MKYVARTLAAILKTNPATAGSVLVLPGSGIDLALQMVPQKPEIEPQILYMKPRSNGILPKKTQNLFPKPTGNPSVPRRGSSVYLDVLMGSLFRRTLVCTASPMAEAT